MLDPEFAEPIARLSQAMSDKLVKARERFGSDWLETPVADLWGMIKDQLDRDAPDPVDIANFALMIHAHTAQADVEIARQRIKEIGDLAAMKRLQDEAKPIEERYPHLTKATLEISYDNGGIFAGRTEQDVRDKLTQFVRVNDKGWDFAAIDAWLGSLPEEDLRTVCCGETSDQDAVLKAAPPRTSELLGTIFDEVG